MQIRRKRDLFAFYKVDPLLLWFLNTIGCYKRLVLDCFTYNSAFRGHISDIFSCDNCFYSSYKAANARNDSSVPN